MNIKSVLSARYISFGTYRKNGDIVDTPVWAGDDGDRLYVFSSGDAGKVKRLRNGNRARVAPCTATGKVLGDYVDASAVLVDEPDVVARAYRALRRKYGWQMRMLDAMAMLAGRYNKRQIIEIRLQNSGA